MIQQLYRRFRFLCSNLDENHLAGRLELGADGKGEFLLMEQRSGTILYPVWAKPQRLQVSWSSTEEGDVLLAELEARANCVEVKITVSSGVWKNAEEKAVMDRIASVCVGTTEGVRLKSETEAGYKWHLKDSGNDWWATGLEDEGEDKVVRVAYRYGSAPVMLAMQAFLDWVFKK